ncbi:MAG TPA: alpha/beta fold hydrolase [Terracidiphilus sp.]|nr:alpha/beta fold hydrolase [Terracidiphilus sp.]
MKRSFSFLLPAVLVLPFSTFSQEPQVPAIPLTVEKIFSHGSLLGDTPEDLSWSPDGRHMSYMDGGELIDIDPGTAKAHVLVSRAKMASLEESRASERDRDHRARYGEAAYQWAPDSKHLLFDSDGRLWMYDLSNGTGIELGFTGEASEDDPKFSPNGESISFVRNHGLAVLRLRDSGTNPFMVAPAPNETTFMGQVDWVYEEELDVRSNYFWSPDSKNIAFLEMNETDVPLYPITDWIPTHPSLFLQRYPQPGDPNPNVRVGVISASGGRTAWVRLPIQAGNDYIPRFGWVDRKTLWIETLTRDHKHRTIFFANPGNGEVHSVLEVNDDKFLDENYDVSVADGTIVLTSWSDGHNHIYLYTYDEHDPDATSAKLEKQLTSGNFDVAGIARVDRANKMVYYASNEGNVLETQVWQVSFDGVRKQLSSESGNHFPNFGLHGDNFVDRFSSRMRPPEFELCHGAGTCSVFWSTHALEPYGLTAPEQLQVKARDGSPLYATLLLPPGDRSPASVPLIVNPYGGPGPQEVANRWSDALLFDELLAEHGFAVLHADNRGTGMRGRAFAQAAYHNFGPVQLEDQLTVVDSVLAKYPELDSKRLGWWGWSWGGTFTLYAMTHSARFRAGVAVAPVTDWRDYDSIYTERYLGQPSQDPDAYKDFSVVNSAADMKGRLLLVQGTGDDNVHLENVVQFIQRLIEADLPYDLQIYPRKTHSISGPDVRTHLYNRILAQFEQYLMPPVK